MAGSRFRNNSIEVAFGRLVERGGIVMPKLETGTVCRRLLLKVALIVLFSILSYLVLAGIKLSNGAAAEPSAIVTLSEGETRSLGWDPAGLEKVLTYLGGLSSDSMLIVTNGRTVMAYGDPSRRFHLHSIRKSFLNALIGSQVGSKPGEIDLDATLAELGIDDSPDPLTPLQKQATVRHLLMSVSGINHAAAAEAGLTAEKQRRLGTGENPPGSIWAYNNWDYNVLTSLFEQTAGQGVARAFEQRIAAPLGMQDFAPSDVDYAEAPELSQHRAAMFHMSARDLARFGQLYLDKGAAGGQRVLSETWIAQIQEAAVATGNGGLRNRQGFLWWLPAAETGLPEGSFWAWGLGQQALFVIPAWDSVIVHQSDTTAFRKRFFALIREEGLAPAEAFEKLALSCHQTAGAPSDFCIHDRFILRREFAQLLMHVAAARGEK